MARPESPNDFTIIKKWHLKIGDCNCKEFEKSPRASAAEKGAPFSSEKKQPTTNPGFISELEEKKEKEKIAPNGDKVMILSLLWLVTVITGMYLR